MRGSAFIAFFGIATAISASLVGCGDEDETGSTAPKVLKSGENESCTRTDDCDTDLVCVNLICVSNPSGTGGTDSGGGGTAGTSRGGSTSSPLGGPGESCTKRADCQQGLGCFNQHCAETDTGEGGAPSTPTGGSRGETCVLSSDCVEGLVCLPSAAQSSVGVCTIGDATTTPSGMVCRSAECREAEDCCELPIDLHGPLGATSCAEIEDTLAGDPCDETTPVLLQPLCLARDAYCDCAADAWACNDGFCAYTADCTASGSVPGGCPPSTRTGLQLYTTCDTVESNKCQPAPVDPLCVEDADCDGLPVTDDVAVTRDTCEGGECTCFERRCLRKCDEDFDCARNYECDTGDHVCVPQAACTSNETCQSQLRDVRAVCRDSACTVPCTKDLDCNASLTGQFTQVCDTDGMCKALGCTSDNECPEAANGARTLCTEPAAAPATLARSAITD